MSESAREKIERLATDAKREIMIRAASVAVNKLPEDRLTVDAGDWQKMLDPAHAKVDALRDEALRLAVLVDEKEAYLAGYRAENKRLTEENESLVLRHGA